MSEQIGKVLVPSSDVKENKGLTRRAFLNLIIKGTGGFLTAAALGPLAPDFFHLLPPPPTEKRMKEFTHESVRALDTEGNVVPLGVAKLMRERSTGNFAYARVEAIPWSAPFRLGDLLVAPIIIPSHDSGVSPSLQYVCYGDEKNGVAIAHTNHPNKITQGLGQGDLTWGEVSLAVATKLLRPGYQTKFHFALSESGHVNQKLTLGENDLIKRFGDYSGVILNKIFQGDAVSPNNVLGQNFWVETIH